MKLEKQEFQNIFDEYYNPLCNFCGKYLNRDADAEDVVQEVFIHIWNKREQISFDKGVKYYLFTSVKNRAIDAIRKKKREQEGQLAIKNVEISEDPLGDEPDTYVLKEKMYKSIKQLPPKCQEIFVMSKVNGLTYNEIAEELGLSVKTVENQIRRAFQLLRERLKSVKS